MTKQNRLLLIDDDYDLCQLLIEYLSKEDFHIDAIHDGKQGLAQAQQNRYDLIILDVMLPGMNGIEVLKHLQKKVSTPVLMLTAKGDEIDRIVGLEVGADDYLPKPCSPRELVARIRAILRRLEKNTKDRIGKQNILSNHTLKLDLNTHEVFLETTKIALTQTEFSILTLLMQNAGTVVSKELLSEQALGRPIAPFDRSLDMHISHLRSKLAPTNNKAPALIKTIRAIGYLIEKEKDND
jgi:DNA-binding response OmpR family regulator